MIHAIRFTFHAKNEARENTLPWAKMSSVIPPVARVEYYKARGATVEGHRANGLRGKDFGTAYPAKRCLRLWTLRILGSPVANWRATGYRQGVRR